ncbi:flagellar biosynthetic protein FliO [bacterium]|nr:flagellar biosynthetic protein FliO [bacterium]
MGYLGNFIVYAMAMVGVIVVALLAFKFTTSGGTLARKSKYLRLVDTMSLGQRKNLYIVSTGKEQFLIAGDVDKTTLISKLETVEPETEISAVKEQKSFRETLNNLPRPDFMDKSNIGIRSSMLSKKPVMVSMLERMNGKESERVSR